MLSGHILAVSCMRLSHTWGCPFSKFFQSLYIFAQIFKYFAFFVLFLPFFWKIAHMPLLSRVAPGYDLKRWGRLQNYRRLIFGKKYEHNIFSVKDLSILTGRCKEFEHNRCNLDCRITLNILLFFLISVFSILKLLEVLTSMWSIPFYTLAFERFLLEQIYIVNEVPLNG